MQCACEGEHYRTAMSCLWASQFCFVSDECLLWDSIIKQLPGKMKGVTNSSIRVHKFYGLVCHEITHNHGFRKNGSFCSNTDCYRVFICDDKPPVRAESGTIVLHGKSLTQTTFWLDVWNSDQCPMKVYIDKCYLYFITRSLTCCDIYPTCTVLWLTYFCWFNGGRVSGTFPSQFNARGLIYLWVHATHDADGFRFSSLVMLDPSPKTIIGALKKTSSGLNFLK